MSSFFLSTSLSTSTRFVTLKASVPRAMLPTETCSTRELDHAHERDAPAVDEDAHRRVDQVREALEHRVRVDLGEDLGAQRDVARGEALHAQVVDDVPDAVDARQALSISPRFQGLSTQPPG